MAKKSKEDLDDKDEVKDNLEASDDSSDDTLWDDESGTGTDVDSDW